MPSEKMLNIPRIYAKRSSLMGKIIDYLEKHSTDLHHLAKEFLYHSFKVRVLSEDLDKDDFQGQEHLALEGWKSIYYHWGNIESVCRASGISIEDVIERFNGSNNSSSDGSKGEQNPLKGMKISDFMSLVEDSAKNGSNDSDEVDDTFAKEEKERVSDISGVFGA